MPFGHLVRHRARERVEDDNTRHNECKPNGGCQIEGLPINEPSDQSNESHTDTRPNGVGHRNRNTAQRQRQEIERGRIAATTMSDGHRRVNPADALSAEVAATSLTMASARWCQGCIEILRAAGTPRASKWIIG